MGHSQLRIFPPEFETRYSILHSIDEKINSIDKEKLLFLASLDWKFMFLAFVMKLVFILVTTSIISSLKGARWPNYNCSYPKKLFRTARFVFSLTYTQDNVDRPSLLSIVFFGPIIFNFLVQQIVSMNIKTNKVLVDTDSLIYDRRSLFESQRKVAWLGNERDMFVARDSPENTFLHNLYYLKNERPVRTVKTQLDADMIRALYENLFFMDTLTSSVALNNLAPICSNKLFINHVPLFSSYKVYYRKKERSPKMAYLDEFVTRNFEGGIEEHIRDLIRITKMSDDQDSAVKNKVFRSVEAYVLHNTYYEPINFYNLYYIFAALLTAYTSIGLLFVTVRLAGQLKVWCSVISAEIRLLSGRLLNTIRQTVRKLRRRLKPGEPTDSG